MRQLQCGGCGSISFSILTESNISKEPLTSLVTRCQGCNSETIIRPAAKPILQMGFQVQNARETGGGILCDFGEKDNP